MTNKNICKFILPNVTKTLTVSNYVFETDKDIMLEQKHLQSHILLLVTSGNGIFCFNKTENNLKTGDIIIGFKGENFYTKPDKDTEYIYISFDGIRSGEIFTRFGIDVDNRVFAGFQGIIPLWKESLSHANEITIDLAAESILLYTFSRFIPQPIQRDSAVGRMIEYTKEHFSDPELSINSLSQSLAYNPKYLSYTFKKEMGMGYSEYLRNMRLKFAVSLFDNGINSVKNVALLSGFSDALYFSTIFKKNMGITPKEYRDNLLK